MTTHQSISGILSLCIVFAVASDAFSLIGRPPRFGIRRCYSTTLSASTRGAVATTRTTRTTRTASDVQGTRAAQRRKELLARRGPHFALDKGSGRIEFGATTKLVTGLLDDDHGADADLINTWLKDGRGLALSIWDERLMTDVGASVYRLQVMTIKFFTLRLAPWVDMEMKTQTSAKTGNPVFTLQSVGFEPNVELVPGMSITAESLGIVIEVSGMLKATADGKGVAGIISFQTSGKLPLALRILPTEGLRVASNSINDTIIKFATKSFQKGARAKFLEFLEKNQKH